MDVSTAARAAARRLSRSGAAAGTPLATRAIPERKRELVTYGLYRAAERVIGAVPRWLAMPAA